MNIVLARLISLPSLSWDFLRYPVLVSAFCLVRSIFEIQSGQNWTCHVLLLMLRVGGVRDSTRVRDRSSASTTAGYLCRSPKLFRRKTDRNRRNSSTENSPKLRFDCQSLDSPCLGLDALAVRRSEFLGRCSLRRRARALSPSVSCRTRAFPHPRRAWCVCCFGQARRATPRPASRCFACRRRPSSSTCSTAPAASPITRRFQFPGRPKEARMLVRDMRRSCR